MSGFAFDLPFPPAVGMIYGSTPEECIALARKGLDEGCDAFGFGGEFLQKEYRNEKGLKRIFAAFADKPFFVTAYAKEAGKDDPDDACADFLLLTVSCGAKVCDIPADWFCRDATGFTTDGKADEKQKQLISKIRTAGGKVILSSHPDTFLGENAILSIAKGQAARGADIVKIVNRCDTKEELVQNEVILSRLREESDRPFLFLTMGQFGMPLRLSGAKNGCCMSLCRLTDEGFQPTVEQIKNHL